VNVIAPLILNFGMRILPLWPQGLFRKLHPSLSTTNIICVFANKFGNPLLGIVTLKSKSPMSKSYMSGNRYIQD